MKRYKHNKKIIDSIVLAGNLAITKDALLSAVQGYNNDIIALENGAKYKDLGISKRRASSKSLAYNNGDFQYINEDTTPDSVAYHVVKGVMRVEDGMSSYGIRSLTELMYSADKNPNISFHLIDVSSGGGYSTAGDFLDTAVIDMQKPVIALVREAGSAAYKGIMNADFIMMSGEGSEAGSIGTYSSVNKEFLQWYKDNYEDFYSKKSSDKNRAFRDLMEGDPSSLINQTTESDQLFMDSVSKSRNLLGNVSQTLSGGMFKGQDAVNRGLADEVGSLAKALDLGYELSEKSKDMSSFKSVIQALNKKFFKGNELSEESTIEEVSSAVNGIEINSLEASSIREEMKLMKENLETEFNAKLDAFDISASVKKAVEPLNEKIGQLEASNKELSEQLQARIKANKAIAQKVAQDPTKPTNSDKGDIEVTEKGGVTKVKFKRLDNPKK